jgi:hypothetical protein
MEGVGIKADPIGVKPSELFEAIVQRIDPLIQWNGEEVPS